MMRQAPMLLVAVPGIALVGILAAFLAFEVGPGTSRHAGLGVLEQSLDLDPGEGTTTHVASLRTQRTGRSSAFRLQ